MKILRPLTGIFLGGTALIASYLMIVVTLAGQDVRAQGETKKVNILVIGNSFSGNALKYLEKIVVSAGDCEMKVGHASIGGCPLEKHLNLAMKHEKNPSDPEGMPYTLAGKKGGLKEMLSADKWDCATIQQYSMYSFKIDTFRPHAKELCDYIRKYAPQAEIIFHQTWAYRSDDPLFVKGFTQEKMYQELTKAYYTVAGETGIKRVIPVGNAFQLTSESQEWAFKRDPSFDYSNPKQPGLPAEPHSLHAGFGWRKKGDKTSFSYDGHHAGPAGEFLAGCVWCESLFGKDVRKTGFKPEKMTPEDAAFLKSIAHKAVIEDVKPAAWPFSGPEQKPASNQ